MTDAQRLLDLAEVTQEDRDSAAPILRLYGAENYAVICEKGLPFCDQLPIVQAFAHHRTEAHRKGFAEGKEAAAAWQPIETAPKDGTEVLVYIRPKVIRLGWFFAPSSRTANWCDENGRHIKPTHWMPLPDAPDDGVGEL